MPMPEAPVNENHGFVFGQYQVGFSGQALIVQPVPEPVGVKKFPDDQFRFRILSPDPGHIVGTYGFGVDVGHTLKIRHLTTPVGRGRLQITFCPQFDKS